MRISWKSRETYESSTYIPDITISCRIFVWLTVWLMPGKIFIEAADAIRNEEKRSASPAMIGIAYFDKLFEIERSIAALAPDERKLKREELSQPVLNELRSWISKLNAPPKSLLGKAANYVISQWSWLTACAVAVFTVVYTISNRQPAAIMSTTADAD